jgi:hypothetical protein
MNSYYVTLDLKFRDNEDLDNQLTELGEKGYVPVISREKWFGGEIGGIVVITFRVTD